MKLTFKFLALFALLATAAYGVNVNVQKDNVAPNPMIGNLAVPSGSTFRILSGGNFQIDSGAVTSFPSGFLTWASVNKTGANLSDLPTRNWSDLQNKPTTLAGYAITDGIDGEPIQQYLTTGTAQFKPHASIAYGNYGFFFDRESSLATRINSTNLRDKINFTAGAMSEIVDGGDGFFYGISEQGTCPIFRFDPATLTTTTFVASSGLVTGVGGSIAADGAGNLYIVGSIAGTNANSRAIKYRISDAAILVNRLIVGYGWGHACRIAGGGLVISGMGPGVGASNGWYAKLALSDLTNLIAPVSFNPPGGSEHLFVPTDDFANDATYAYFVSESVGGLSGDNWMARLNLTSGTINYYAMPGGTISAAYLAVWDGGTKVYIPQFLRRGKIAVFDTVAATFSELPINVFGPINEMIRAGNSWLVSTYSNSAGNAEAGVVTRLNLGELNNFGPYMFPNGDIILPTAAQIYFGDGSNNGISIGGIGFPSGTFDEIGAQRIVNLTTDGLVKVSGGIGTLGTAESGVDYYRPFTATDSVIGLKLPSNDTYAPGDEGQISYLPGQGLTILTSNGRMALGDVSGGGMAVVTKNLDQVNFDPQAYTATTTFASVSLSSGPLSVGKYSFEFATNVDCSAAGGHKIRIVFQGGTVTNILINVMSVDLTTRAIVIAGRLTASGGAGLGQSGATQVETIVRGTFEVTAGETDVAPEMSQNVASGTTTVLGNRTFKTRVLQ
jgi:hypothetical protein